MIKPLPTKIAGKIMTHFHEHGLRITKLKKARLTADDVNTLYKMQLTDPTFQYVLFLNYNNKKNNFKIVIVSILYLKYILLTVTIVATLIVWT